MLKTCISCNNSFEGRKQAKTCSSRCRKRLQRLNQATSKAIKEVETAAESTVHKIIVKVEDEVKGFEDSAQQLAHDQAGFVAIGNQQEKISEPDISISSELDTLPVSTQPLPLAQPPAEADFLKSEPINPTEQPKPEQKSSFIDVKPPATPTTEVTASNVNPVTKEISDPGVKPPAESVLDNPVNSLVKLPVVEYLESPDPLVPNIETQTVMVQPQRTSPSSMIKARRKLFNLNKAILKVATVSLLLTVLVGGNVIYLANRRAQQNTGTDSNQTVSEQSVSTTKDQLGLLVGTQVANAAEKELVVQGDGVFTGNIYAANFPGGVGTATTDAGELTSGTLANARLSGNVTLQGNTFNGANQLVQLDGSGFLPALNGAALTSLNAGNVSSGTLSDARLSANVALLNGSGPQVFTGNNRFNGQLLVGSAGGGSVLLQSASTASSFTLTLPSEDGALCTTAGSAACLAVYQGSGSFVQLAPASAQSDTTTNSSINISKSGAGGNLLNLDATNSAANGAQIDVQSSSSSQYALSVTSNNGATQSLYVRADGNVGIGNSSPAALLSVGTTNPFEVDSVGNVTVAAGNSLTLVGGNTASRPSAAEGKMYFDTDTDRLIVYSNGKWQADRAESIIVAASDSTQAEKDSADYVADGTSDEDEINAALTAAAEGKVFLLPGTYTADGSINVPNNTTLAGAGTSTLIRIAAGSSNVDLITATGTNRTGQIVRDLRLDGSLGGSSNDGIAMIFVGDGTGASARAGAQVMNISVENFSGVAIAINSSDNNIIINNVVKNNGGNGINLNTGVNTADNNLVSGNFAQGNGGDGFSMGGDNNLINGNRAQDNTGRGFSLNGSSTHNAFSGNTSEDNDGFGIELSFGADNNSIFGNTLRNNGAGGVLLSASDNVLTSNNISNSGGATINDGIYLSAANRNSVTNNRITDSSCTTNCYAINVTGAASNNNYLADNYISSPGIIRDLGTGTIHGGQLDESNDFVIQGTNSVEVNTASGVDVLTVDAINSQTTLRGINSDAVAGSELVTSQAFNNATYWTCAGWTTTSTTAAHVTGNTTPCTATATNFTVTAGATYQITFQLANNTDDLNTVTPSIGGVSAPTIGEKFTNIHTVVITASNTNALSFTPTTDFNGTISNVSVKAITKSNSVLTLQNSGGTTALEVRATGSNSIFIGGGAGQYAQDGAFGGGNNIGIGINALQSNIDGSSNVAIGGNSLSNNTDGDNNVAIGVDTLQNNTSGSDNLALGSNTLQNNTTGYRNTAIGSGTLLFNTTGGENIAIGQGALQNNTSAFSNTAIGINALNANTTGGSNTGIGSAALASNTTGSNNVGIGILAGYSNATGSNSTYIGNDAGYRDPLATSFVTLNNLTNAGAIGYGAQVQASNSLVLGGQGANQVNVGIGTTRPTNTLSVSPMQYNTGTASQSGTTITGVGTSFTSAMVGSEIIFANGSKATITAVNTGTSMTVTPSQTVSSQAYRIHYPGLQVTSAGNIGIGNTAPASLLSVGSSSQFQVNSSGNVSYVSGTTNTSAYVCRNASGQLAACSTTGSSGPAFIQGGNNFGQTAVLGTNDGANLEFETSGTTKLTLDTSGNLTFAQGANRTLNVASNTTVNGVGYALTLAAGNANGSTTGNTGGLLILQGGNAAGTGNNNGGALLLQGGTRTGSGTSGSVIVRSNSTDSTSAFQVQNSTASAVLTVDTANNITYLRGLNSTATEGSELFTTFGTAAGWTNGCSDTCSTHTSGTTALAASPAVATVSGTVYKVTYTISGSNEEGYIYASIGGRNGTSHDINGTHTDYISANSNTNLTFIPTNNIVATVSDVSVKAMTVSNPVLTVQNSDATTGLEIRAGGSGLNNAFIGTLAGANNVSGSNNLALGASSLQGNTTGAGNLAIGYQSLQANSSGANNVAIGYQSLQANTTGSTNSAIGYQALMSNTTGFYNNAIGESALLSNTTGYQNVAIGLRALTSNTSGVKNTGIGTYALRFNTIGDNNVAIGDQALYSNVGGSQNTAIGASALEGGNGQSVTYSTAVGAYALNGGANYATAVGVAAGLYGGDYSVSLGFNTLTNSQTKSIAIGYQAGSQDPDATSFNSLNDNGTVLTNGSAIGYGAQVQQNNSLVLGGQGINQANVGIGTTRPSNVLSVSPWQYFIGTASQSGTTVTGTGTSWTSAMIGSEIIFANGKKAKITAFNSATSLTVDMSQTAANQAYRIHYVGLQVTSSGNVGIGDTSPAYLLTVGSGGLFGVNSSGNVIVTALGTADTDTVVCRNAANQLAGCTSTFATTTNAFLQGGNSFATTAVLGTNDANSLALETNGTTRLILDTAGNLAFQQATTFATTTGALALQPGADSNLNVNLSGAGDFAVNTNQLYVDTSTGNVGIGTTILTEKLEVAGNIAPDTVTGGDLGTASLEWDELYIGDNNGIKLGLDQDATLAYDETTDDRVELTGTGASMFIEDKLGLGRQTFTMVTAGAATENLTPASSYVEITGQDNAADLVQIQTTGAKEGDILYITNLDATAVNIDQTATTKLSGGTDVILTQYDVIMLIFDGTNWLQAAAVVDNS